MNSSENFDIIEIAHSYIYHEILSKKAIYHQVALIRNGDDYEDFANKIISRMEEILKEPEYKRFLERYKELNSES